MRPCTRCGNCCTAMPCGLALAYVGDHRPCRALATLPDGSHACDLVDNPQDYIGLGSLDVWQIEFVKRFFAHFLGIGFGCCDSPQSRQVASVMRKARARILRNRRKEANAEGNADAAAH